MDVIITIDRYDGATGFTTNVIDMAGLSMSELVFKMMSADVCGITITKVKSLESTLNKLDSLNKKS